MHTVLGQLLRDHRADILGEWEAEVRKAAIAKHLERPRLVDNMPTMLDRLTDALLIGLDATAAIHDPTDDHTGERLALGYDLGELVSEYLVFRKVLLRHVRTDESITAADWDVVSEAIDAAVHRIIDRYTRARERKLRALERISSETLEATDLGALLRHIADVMIDTSPPVDSVVILLREGNVLRVKAAAGLEGDADAGFTLRIGEGFAGKIAETGEPMLLSDDAAQQAIVKSPNLRARGTRTLYGVPLFGDEGLIGVAHMGSREATQLPEEDMLLFRAIANRAAMLISTRQRLDALAATSRFREQFLGILGHDLRNPLNAIMGSATLLLRRPALAEPERRAVVRIARAADRMGRLISDLLDFATSRLGGSIPITPTTLDLCEVCRDVVEELEQANPEREIRFAADCSALVKADRDRIAQVLSNLVANALKFSPADTPVEVVVRTRDDDVEVTVHNGGAPIADEMLPYIFDPFRRAAQSGTKGAGLGLYVVQQIVTAHGGRIEVTSSAASGTTFTVQLPRRRA